MCLGASLGWFNKQEGAISNSPILFHAVCPSVFLKLFLSTLWWKSTWSRKRDLKFRGRQWTFLSRIVFKFTIKSENIADYDTLFSICISSCILKSALSLYQLWLWIFHIKKVMIWELVYEPIHHFHWTFYHGSNREN